MALRPRRALAIAVPLLALVAACGDDDDDDAATTDAPAPAATTAAGADGDAGAIEITLTDEGYEGAPAELPSGVLTITFRNESSGATALDLVQVEDTTTEAQLREAFASAVGGGPIPDVLVGVSGVTDTPPGATTTTSFEVEPGKHFLVSAPVPEEEGAEEGGEESSATTSAAGTTVATEPPAEEEAGPPPEAFLVQEVTVTDEDSGAELPETAGTITAKDYEFTVDAAAGDTLTFRNEGPEQIHHAVLIGFGNADPATVEENLPTFLAAEEDAPPPPGIDPASMNFEVGGSNVFTPGLGGTFSANLESGNTYAVVCFIQDRTGGPPHAIARNMFTVFSVE